MVNGHPSKNCRNRVTREMMAKDSCSICEWLRSTCDRALDVNMTGRSSPLMTLECTVPTPVGACRVSVVRDGYG
jgi:hypothetical protein